MTIITFQQEPDSVQDRRPWPVSFRDTAIIHGRPDALHIIGFAKPGEFTVDVLASDATPENIIDHTPVYMTTDGKMFGSLEIIRQAHVQEYSAEALASLRADEQALRESYARVTGAKI